MPRGATRRSPARPDHEPLSSRAPELIERLTVLAPNDRIDGEAVRDALAAMEPRDHVVDTLADAESEQIRRVLAATGGNKSRAAQILGIERKTLYRKLERMKL